MSALAGDRSMFMPIFKQDPSGKFVPFEPTPFPDLEKKLEDWIETNPHLLIEGERLVVVARQPRTRFGKVLDLLAIDETGATVVIELKRGITPREVVAQAMEYAAWVDSLSFDQLDEMVRAYAVAQGIDADGIVAMHRLAFGDDPSDDFGEDERGDDRETRITFNHRQRLVIVAERISDEVEQTLRYMRTRFAADVYGIAFTVHMAGSETIINTTTVVGREVTPGRTPTAAGQESTDETIARLKSDFLKSAAATVDNKVASVTGLEVERSTTGGVKSGRKVLRNGRIIAWYSYANAWMPVLLTRATTAELATLRSGLSQPQSVNALRHGHGDQYSFRIMNEPDLAIFLRLLEARATEVASA